MEDITLAKQIIHGTAQAVERARKANPGISEASKKEVAAAYLSGINQAASVVVRGDGEIDSHQVERAVRLAGERLGFDFGQPT